MKKLRILSLVLAVVMLGSLAMLFSSCSKDGEMKLSKKVVEVDLTDYTLVYPKSNTKEGTIGTTFKTTMADFVATINTLTGLTLRASSENTTRSTAADPEILVGLTSRSESVEAYESIKGHGYTIQVINNKIVIVGTTNLLTLQAVQYFEQNYLSAEGGTSAKISLNESAKIQNMEMVTIADKEDCYFSFVYSKDLDTDPDNEYGIVDGTGRDYAYDLLLDIENDIIKLTDLDKKAVTGKQKTDETTDSGNELIVGLTTRPASTACRAELGGGEYGFFIRDGKIVLSSWSDKGMMVLGTAFRDYLKESQYTDKDGNYAIVMPAELSFVDYANDNWVTDFTKPEGVELYRTEDGVDDSLIYVYMGEGVNATAYNDYVATLKSEGYAVVTENTVEESIFTFLYNKKENTTLYVAYNAFKHADLEGANFPFEEPTIRIVSAPGDALYIPDTKLTTPRRVTKVTDSSLTAVALPAGSVGTGYVLQLEDGRFIVMDGGGTTKGTEVTNLYNILLDLYKKTWNREPSKDHPIEIAAWLLSHGHGDHTSVFWEFSKTYGKKNWIQLDYVVGNYPASSYVYNTGEAGAPFSDNFKRISEMYTNPFTYLRVHTGQKIYFGNVELEILFTPEDMLPHKIVTLNDSSVIVRFSIQSTEGGANAGDPHTFMWTGDAYRYGGMWVSAIFGEYIDSDMVAISHHGGPGVENLFYDLITPELVWFPTLRSSYNGYMGSGSWFGKVDQHVCKEMECVKYIIIADAINTTVFFKKDGPDMENLYAAASDEEDPYFSERENCLIKK